jgi:hypothetical protein
VLVVVVLVLFEFELSPLAGCVTVVGLVVDVVFHGCQNSNPATMATITTTKMVIAVRFDPEPSLTTMLRSSFMPVTFSGRRLFETSTRSMAGGVKSLLNAVVVIVLVVWLLKVFGLWSYVTHLRAGS